MADHVSVLFVGSNGLGTVSLGFNPGTAGAKVVMVQQIFSSISGSTVDILDRTGSFSSDIYNGSIDQTGSNDWTDCLFLAVVQLP
jgi:hypothetical protein